MTRTEALTIAAVLLSPLLALQVQVWLERIRHSKQRKLNVFRTLMSTRAARLSREHVAALNMIDMEFYGPKLFGIRLPSPSDKKVRQAWREYFAALVAPTPPEDRQAPFFAAREVKFIKLLEVLAKALRYDFDEVYLKENMYTPVAHGQLEDEDRLIRQTLIQILTGERPLPITSIVDEETVKSQEEAKRLLAANLDPTRVLNIRIIENQPTAATSESRA